ncbi:MAG TPA: hypothetical protein VEU33_23805, partial [Archangium sp.]|nr:hypothetical protein [Archangium sp.]
PMRCAAGDWLCWRWRLGLEHHEAWRGRRAGASLAPAVGRPRCSTIARTPAASFTDASTRRLPPHLTQANTSKANVLLSNSAKVYSRRLLYRLLFGNYGNFYDQTFTVRNTGTACMRVRAEYVSYANVASTQRPIYDIYNQLYNANPAGFPTMYWNAPLRYAVNGGTFSAVYPVILYPSTNFSAPNAVPPTIRKGIWEGLITPTLQSTIQIQTAVPGLIRAPTAMVFTSTRC